MIDTVMPYLPEQRELYRKGVLWAKWERKYGRSTLFQEMVADPGWPYQRQFPVKHPPLKSQTYGFGELFAGIHYINLGYEVHRYYYDPNCCCAYAKALEILGAKGRKVICKSFPQPPDLLVFDRKGRFFFVEVKLPGDRLNENQIRFFKRIENHLIKYSAHTKRARHIDKEHWIRLLRLVPAK